MHAAKQLYGTSDGVVRDLTTTSGRKYEIGMGINGAKHCNSLSRLMQILYSSAPQPYLFEAPLNLPQSMWAVVPDDDVDDEDDNDT